MRNSLLLGVQGFMLPIPQALWQHQIRRNAIKARRMLAFMSPKHHRFRDFVFKQIPRTAHAPPPAYIAHHLNLPIDDVKAVLDILEKKPFFLFRNDRGEVVWAYPVTVDTTPHRIRFSSGEQLYAA